MKNRNFRVNNNLSDFRRIIQLEVDYCELNQDFLFTWAYNDLYYLNYEKSIRQYNPKLYLGSTFSIQSSDPDIIHLSNSLVNDSMTDYEKLFHIHEWVITNIAYDVEMYFSGTYTPQDAVSVLENKKGVCAGYANLMAALLRAQGISTKGVSGFALGAGTTGSWDNYDLEKLRSNHAWNEVYVDGRWVTVDATWNSGHLGTDSSFVFRKSYRFFDPTLESFSQTHYLINPN